jgi:hypothetical protein
LIFDLSSDYRVSKLEVSMPPSRFPIPQGTLDMLVLQILSIGPAHGYAVAQRLEQISRAVVQARSIRRCTASNRKAGCALNGKRRRPGATPRSTRSPAPAGAS